MDPFSHKDSSEIGWFLGLHGYPSCSHSLLRVAVGCDPLSQHRGHWTKPQTLMAASGTLERCTRSFLSPSECHGASLSFPQRLSVPSRFTKESCSPRGLTFHPLTVLPSFPSPASPLQSCLHLPCVFQAGARTPFFSKVSFLSALHLPNLFLWRPCGTRPGRWRV